MTGASRHTRSHAAAAAKVAGSTCNRAAHASQPADLISSRTRSRHAIGEVHPVLLMPPDSEAAQRAMNRLGPRPAKSASAKRKLDELQMPLTIQPQRRRPAEELPSAAAGCAIAAIAVQLEDRRRATLIELPKELDKLRRGAVEWIIDTTTRLHFHQETAFLACNLLDRYIESLFEPASDDHPQTEEEIFPWLDMRMSTVTAGTLYLAAKYEEPFDSKSRGSLLHDIAEATHGWIDLRDLAYCVFYDTVDESEVLRVEARILEITGFRLMTTSPFTFLLRYTDDELLRPAVAQIEPWSRRLDETALDALRVARSLLMLTLLDAQMGRFRPSMLAAAALQLTIELRRGEQPRQSHGTSMWRRVLRADDGPSLEQQLLPCVVFPADELRQCVDAIAALRQQAIRDRTRLAGLLQLTPTPPVPLAQSIMDQCDQVLHALLVGRT